MNDQNKIKLRIKELTLLIELAKIKNESYNHLQEEINALEKRLEIKFIFIIPPQLTRYIEYRSASRRMHKSQLVRQAIEEMMKKDKEYLKFNKK